MTLNNTPVQQMDSILISQKEYFRTEATLPLDFRRQQLPKLLVAIEKHEQELANALWADLHKSLSMGQDPQRRPNLHRT